MHVCAKPYYARNFRLCDLDASENRVTIELIVLEKLRKSFIKNNNFGPMVQILTLPTIFEFFFEKLAAAEYSFD